MLWDVKLCFENTVKVDWVLSTQRKFKKFTVDKLSRFNLQNLGQQALDVFDLHGSFISFLTLSYCRISGTDYFGDLLKKLPKLAKITIDSCSMIEAHDSNVVLPPLPKLSELYVISSDFELFKLFKSYQLKTLNFQGHTNTFNVNPGSHEALYELFASQASLKSLMLTSISNNFSTLFDTPLPTERVPFRLQKLYLLGFNLSETPENYRNLMLFMKLHEVSLTELELGGYFPSFFYEFVFANLKKVKALGFISAHILKDTGFYNSLETMRNVTQLHLIFPNVTNEKAAAFKTLLERLPNVESITPSLDFCSDVLTLQQYADTLRKLKTLPVNDIPNELREVRFQALNSISLKNFSGENLDNFIRHNRGITKISISEVKEPFNIAAVAENLNLRELTIECEINCDENFFDVIRRNCSQLKLLRLNKKSLKVDISSVVDIPGLWFCDFPDNSMSSERIRELMDG